MIGILGHTERALALAAALALSGEQVLLCAQDAEELAEIRDGSLGVYEKDLSKFLRQAEAGGNLSFTARPEPLFACACVFVSARLVYTDDLDEMLAPLYRQISLLMRRARGPFTLVLTDTLPYGAYRRVRRYILSEKILRHDVSGVVGVLGESVTREDFLTITCNAGPAPDTLDVTLVLSPILAPDGALVAWFKKHRQAVVGSTNEKASGFLKQLYRRLGFAQRSVYVTTPEALEKALMLKDAYQLMRQSFMTEAALSTSTDLFAALVQRQPLPRPALGADNRLRERMRILFKQKPNDILADILNWSEHQTRGLVQDIVTGLVMTLSAEDGQLPEGSVIAVLGAAPKPGSGDMREAAFLSLAAALVGEGARLNVYLPEGTADLKWRLREQKDAVCYAGSYIEAVRGAKALLVLGPPGVAVDLRRTAEAMDKDPVLCDPFGIFEGRKFTGLFRLAR